MDSIVWSKPQITRTKGGAKRQVRTWFIPKDSPFWKLWNDAKSTLKQQGYSVTLWQDRWMLTEWRDVKGETSRASKQAVAAARAQARTNGANENINPDLPAMMQARFRDVVDIYEDMQKESGDDFRFQFPSIKRLALAVEAHGGALDASDTGVGKTAVACAVARVLGRKLLVVCPKSVIPPWAKFARRFGLDAVIVNYEMVRTGRTQLGKWGERKQFQWNSEMMDPDDWLFVFDECHRLKDSRTQNCAMGVSALTLQYRVLGLSATAADNPLHMKFSALLTGLIEHPSHWWGWLFSNGVRKGKWGMEFVGGHEVLQRLHRQIFPDRGSRIRIADLGDLFPVTQIAAEAYDMGQRTTAEINRVYQTMRREITKLEQAKAHDWQANVLTTMLRARQETELLKVPTLVSMANDGLEEGLSVIIMLNYSDSVEACARELKCPYTITGADKPGERQQTIDAFNADEIDSVVMNIRAGGLGISLHGTRTSRRRLVLISPTPSAIDIKQAVGRAHRAAGAVSIQRIVYAAGTIEEDMCDKVRPKLRRIDMLNDGDLQLPII